MRTSAAGSSRPGGFTLLELLVALAIVALVTALAAPALASRLLEPPAARTARLVRGLVEEGRETAATRSRAMAVVWAPAFGRFALLPADSADATPARSLDVPPSVTVETRGLLPVQGGPWGGNGALGLLLLPVGGSTGGDVVLGSAGERLVVRVDPLTGYASYASTGAGDP